MIKCGHCQKKHNTAAEVRDCYQGNTLSNKPTSGVPSLTAMYDRETRRRQQQYGGRGGNLNAGMVRTNPQTGIMAQLRSYNDRNPQPTLDDSRDEFYEREQQRREAEDDSRIRFYQEGAQHGAISQADADRYRRNVKPAAFPKVSDGYYAVEHEGTLKFYHVNTPTEGKWAGFTFLEVQASDDFHPIKNRETKRQILSLIAADEKAALLRYGQELGICGRCHRTLTDEESRARGIGPICAGKEGW